MRKSKFSKCNQLTLHTIYLFKPREAECFRGDMRSFYLYFLVFVHLTKCKVQQNVPCLLSASGCLGQSGETVPFLVVVRAWSREVERCVVFPWHARMAHVVPSSTATKTSQDITNSGVVLHSRVLQNCRRRKSKRQNTILCQRLLL